MHFTTILNTAFLAIVSGALAAPLAQSGSGSSSSNYFPSVTEIGWCMIPWNVDDCVKAQGHADIAAQAAQNLFPANTLHNGKGDAFRHCYWNARMTIDLGAGNAKSIGDNHEDGSNGPAEEKRMDLANNASGRNIGASAGSYASAQEACRVAAVNGRLVTLK
ncbi:hypothetical protein EPUS_00732 [Endocarpon pusillum Z07020]|uniref:DUF6973 domain-containing protein n=1 Tax=Endocarpon pusillum (strain Z07020 / HMAS-L-300199) TaxID=1263415 RepID=U1GAQ8_ENDPU|nr:uncharacterized protein EPUS_00732 [Endocarpon pusillum Z07020]ERF74602.1 hypothetical protein EPUS_00732 [Endocarpon pusillum Z07020]